MSNYVWREITKILIMTAKRALDLLFVTSTISLMLYSQLYRVHCHSLVIGGFQSGERYEIQGHSHKIRWLTVADFGFSGKTHTELSLLCTALVLLLQSSCNDAFLDPYVETIIEMEWNNREWNNKEWNSKGHKTTICTHTLFSSTMVVRCGVVNVYTERSPPPSLTSTLTPLSITSRQRAESTTGLNGKRSTISISPSQSSVNTSNVKGQAWIQVQNIWPATIWIIYCRSIIHLFLPTLLFHEIHPIRHMYLKMSVS